MIQRQISPYCGGSASRRAALSALVVPKVITMIDVVVVAMSGHLGGFAKRVADAIRGLPQRRPQ